MASSTKFCGAGANGVVAGTTNWVNPTNIYADDGNNASCSPTVGGGSSNDLLCTSFGFTTGDVPSGSTISGVSFTFNLASAINDFGLQIYRVQVSMPGGILSGNNLGDNAQIPFIEPADRIYGGSTELWGLAIVDTDVLDVSFGVALGIKQMSVSAWAALVDYVKCTVYFAESYATKMFPFDVANVGPPFERRLFALGT